jgi:hypothetical protein
MEDDLDDIKKMEDKLKKNLKNGRRPQKNGRGSKPTLGLAKLSKIFILNSLGIKRSTGF